MDFDVKALRVEADHVIDILRKRWPRLHVSSWDYGMRVSVLLDRDKGEGVDVMRIFWPERDHVSGYTIMTRDRAETLAQSGLKPRRSQGFGSAAYCANTAPTRVSTGLLKRR